VPLSPTLMQADLVRALKLPVLLVVGLRLGCINHALLSARAIADDGCILIGWIGNRIDPDMARVDDNIATLRARLPTPVLGVLPANAPEPGTLVGHLREAVSLISSGACRRAP
jgi:dethiobiotin synthetase